MQLPAAALFGAGNVAVSVLPPEASSEMKRYIFSTRFRIAVQLSDRGGSRIFIEEGLQVLGAPFWLLKGCQVSLERTVMVEKAPFRTRRAPLLAGATPHLLRRARSWTKRAPSLIRRAPSLAGRRPHNAFGAKTDPGVR